MATMGSLTRVAVEYRDLEEYLAAVSRTPMRRGEDLSVSMTNQGGSVSKDAEQNPPVLTDIPPSQEGRHIY